MVVFELTINNSVVFRAQMEPMMFTKEQFVFNSAHINTLPHGHINNLCSILLTLTLGHINFGPH